MPLLAFENRGVTKSPKAFGIEERWGWWEPSTSHKLISLPFIAVLIAYVAN
jgi:hypothetical protein